MKTPLFLFLALAWTAASSAIEVKEPTAPKPPCCREGLPLGKRSEAPIYKLDDIWTSDVGREVKLEVLRGHPQVLALFFTSCEHSCPLIVNDMKAIEKALPRGLRPKVDFLLVSIDPERDTPEVLHAYRAKHQLGIEHWTLLRGSPASVKRLADIVGFQYYPGSQKQYAHSLVITILDGNGEIVFQQAGIGALPDGAVDTLLRLSRKGAKPTHVNTGTGAAGIAKH